MSVAETVLDVQQYLTFRLGEETFGVNVLKVKEVLSIINITQVPQTPDYMLGVINLRGSVVPVVDLRQRFRLAKAEQTRDTCIVVLEVELGGEQVTVGAMTDAVEEVIDINAAQIEPPPKLGTQLNVEFIDGMGKINDDNFVILLNINMVFSAEELKMFMDAGDAREAV